MEQEKKECKDKEEREKRKQKKDSIIVYGLEILGIKRS